MQLHSITPQTSSSHQSHANIHHIHPLNYYIYDTSSGASILRPLTIIYCPYMQYFENSYLRQARVQADQVICVGNVFLLDQ